MRRSLLAIVPCAIALAAAAPVRAPAEAAPAAARLGPPWISIEYPANPYDRTARGAFLLVHAFHHRTALALPLSGTAEGIVGGERRTVRLAFDTTGRPGVYALRRQWDTRGTWTLVVRAAQGPDDAATALVELAPGGEVARVTVPTRQLREGSFPRAVTAAEVDTALRARAAQLASSR